MKLKIDKKEPFTSIEKQISEYYDENGKNPDNLEISKEDFLCIFHIEPPLPPFIRYRGIRGGIDIKIT